MGYGQLVAKQFTAPKLFFYTLFWGIHIFLFAYGWYVWTEALRDCTRVRL